MTGMELQRGDVTRRAPSNARLARALTGAAAQEAVAAARSLAVDLLGATIHGSERAQRSTGTLYLLLLHAMNEHCSPSSRETRWRRFIRIADAVQTEAPSPALRQLISENADLIDPLGCLAGR